MLSSQATCSAAPDTWATMAAAASLSPAFSHHSSSSQPLGLALPLIPLHQGGPVAPGCCCPLSLTLPLCPVSLGPLGVSTRWWQAQAAPTACWPQGVSGGDELLLQGERASHFLRSSWPCGWPRGAHLTPLLGLPPRKGPRARQGWKGCCQAQHP